MKKITIYSKFCIGCLWPQELEAIETYCAKTGTSLEKVRTVLDDHLHEIATELWGSPNYLAFVDDGNNIYSLEEYVKKLKKKPATRTKKASVGGKNGKAK